MHTEHLFISPGISDVFSFLEGRIPYVFGPSVTLRIFRVGWKNNRISFDQKMENFLSIVDPVTDRFGPVSLVGISAGASFMLNAYMERKAKIKAVISVCGRLRAGKLVFPPLNLAAIQSPAFYESVLLAEENQKKMNEVDREKFMTLSSLLDEQVPGRTSRLAGATNLTIPMVGHIFSQAYALRRINKQIVDFISK